MSIEIGRRLIGGIWRTGPQDEAAGGGSVTPPVELTGTDPVEAVLTLRADDAQAEHIFRVYNLDGDLALDVDNAGILDTILFNVQEPPDTGGGAGSSSSQVRPGGWRINSGTDVEDPLTITKWDAGALDYRPRLRVKYSDSEILEFQPIAGEVSVTVFAPATPTGNFLEVWDNPFNNMLFAVTYTGGVIFSSTDPHVAGAWWDDAGTLTRSSG